MIGEAYQNAAWHYFFLKNEFFTVKFCFRLVQYGVGFKGFSGNPVENKIFLFILKDPQ